MVMIRNIQIEFGLTFHNSNCVGHPQCPNIYCVTCIIMEVFAIAASGMLTTPTSFCVGDVAPEQSKVDCKVCHFAHVMDLQ